MKIIDARSGREDLKPLDVVTYPDGEWWQLVRVEDRLFSATAFVYDHTTGGNTDLPPKAVPLAVRFMHPAFMFQRVAFFPS